MSIAMNSIRIPAFNEHFSVISMAQQAHTALEAHNMHDAIFAHGLSVMALLYFKP